MTQPFDRFPVPEATNFLTKLVQKSFGAAPQVDCNALNPHFRAVWPTADKERMNNLAIEVRKIFGKSARLALHAGQATLEVAQTPAAMIEAIDDYLERSAGPDIDFEAGLAEEQSTMMTRFRDRVTEKWPLLWAGAVIGAMWAPLLTFSGQVVAETIRNDRNWLDNTISVVFNDVKNGIAADSVVAGEIGVPLIVLVAMAAKSARRREEDLAP